VEFLLLMSIIGKVQMLNRCSVEKQEVPTGMPTCEQKEEWQADRAK
jgi:hypothetical protein